MIEVKNLVKKYGSHIAVDHLSFSIEKGQIYGFLGPNGAGKSTTMNIMTGYLGATEGQVIINGHDILKEPEEAKKSIGYLPELPPLYTDMRVCEYLQFAAELKGIKKAKREESVEEVVKLAKLKDVEMRLIRNLSKGYRQRVGLAQAMLGFPEIIILDEPTVGLDPKQIIEIRELIRKLAKNHTVILSSHILAEVSEVCDTVLIISKGKLVASDTPKNLEKLMAGAESIEITTKASRSDVREILSGVEGIIEIKTEQKQDGTTYAKIDMEEDQDIREAVFFAFAKAQKALLSMNHTKVSLEDVFLELTQSEKQDLAEDDEDLQDPEETADEKIMEEDETDESNI
ncbi:MAG: ATP-binding cassette domain-containing protein [Hespellia sp.]|nr:ATP-binding cassette domain-containing protein [Hespellia sp.]